MERTSQDPHAVIAALERRASQHRSGRPGPLPGPAKRPSMASNDSLRYLHGHWLLPDKPQAALSGTSWKRLVLGLASRLTFGALSSYMAEERNLLAQTVQVCEALARRVDTLEAEVAELAEAASAQLGAIADAVDMGAVGMASADETAQQPPASEGTGASDAV